VTPRGDDVAPGRLRISRTCVIDADELEWRYSASGGPGGQHANTSNTKVEVRFDIEASRSLGPRQRERLLEKLGPFVRVVASDRRSQAQNRELALERLRDRIAAALVVETQRRATKPSRAAKTARLDAKRKRSDTKRARQRPTRGDD
jgi:ribosome-associated protein